MAVTAVNSGRFMELLAGEAAGDLTSDELAELRLLDAVTLRNRRDQFMTAAGLAQVAFLKADPRRPAGMPVDVQDRLLAKAARWSAEQQAAAEVAPPETSRAAPVHHTRGTTMPKPSRAGWIGWSIAAALALTILAGRVDVPGTSAPPTMDERRAALIRQSEDLLRVSWSRSAVAGFENASGDVVWSNSRQEGYLRLAGLPPNDRSVLQYQLWIVDPQRDAHPVDGGLFDVTHSGELVIPIQARLPVIRPAAFAITAEQPGGVVVSDGPMLLVAAVGS